MLIQEKHVYRRQTLYCAFVNREKYLMRMMILMYVCDDRRKKQMLRYLQEKLLTSFTGTPAFNFPVIFTANYSVSPKIPPEDF